MNNYQTMRTFSEHHLNPEPEKKHDDQNNLKQIGNRGSGRKHVLEMKG